MTDKQKKPLPELLRAQVNKPSWNRDPSLLEAAATEIDTLQYNISLNNEFFGGQLTTLKKKVAELEKQLKINDYILIC